jgi:hypothetical protein
MSQKCKILAPELYTFNLRDNRGKRIERGFSM